MRILHSKKLVFISKPRCGSTSIRNFLTQNCSDGDVICNIPDHDEGLHPHMSATSVKKYLSRKGFNPSEYNYFTVTRNPIDMLWSYYKYFKPDSNNRYNYSNNYIETDLMDFETWLNTGHVGLGRVWKEYVPPFVTEKNFSPLSLEAHICDKDGRIDVDNYFYLENLLEVEGWLCQFFDKKVTIPDVNNSDPRKKPIISDEILSKLRKQFPMENKHYKF